MVSLYTFNISGMTHTDIWLTRGDAAIIILPIYKVNADGSVSDYTPAVGDTFAVTVRAAQITNSGTPPAVVINGTVTASGSNLEWSISHSDSTIDAGPYFWDAQITTDDGVFTIYGGELHITPEVTT